MEIDAETYAICVSFSPDRNLIAVGTKEKTVLVVDIDKLDTIQKLEFDYSIYAVEWSPDGKYLAIGGINGPITIWQTKDWKIKITVKDSKGAMNLSWSNDGGYLAVGSWYCSGDKKAEVWSTENWTRVKSNNDYLPRYIGFSPDSKFLAIQYKLEGIEILSVPDFSRVVLLDFSDSEKHVDIYSPAWSANGLYIAASCGDGRIRIWYTDDWSPVKTLNLHGYWEDAQYRVAFSPDNRFLASGGQSSPKLLTQDNWQEVYEFNKIFTEDILEFSWHPNSKYLAIVSQHDKNVRIWEII